MSELVKHCFSSKQNDGRKKTLHFLTPTEVTLNLGQHFLSGIVTFLDWVHNEIIEISAYSYIYISTAN